MQCFIVFVCAYKTKGGTVEWEGTVPAVWRPLVAGARVVSGSTCIFHCGIR